MPNSSQVVGFDVVDLDADPDFAFRVSRAHDYRAECNAIYQMGAALTASTPDLLPQLLCDAVLELCGAESVGISVEEAGPGGAGIMRWTTTAGPFSYLHDRSMPRDASPCGLCLDRGTPQLVAVHQAYYDRLGIRGAPLISQAILIPWHVEGVNGTLWAMQHSPGRDFDPEDLLLLKHLAAFASIAMRHLQHEAAIRSKAAQLAATRLVEELAQRVHNPLQVAVNSLYLASHNPEYAPSYVASAIRQIVRISDVVEELFTHHTRPSANTLGHSPESVERPATVCITCPPGKGTGA